jgi:hypothetical protein
MKDEPQPTIDLKYLVEIEKEDNLINTFTGVWKLERENKPEAITGLFSVYNDIVKDDRGIESPIKVK